MIILSILLAIVTIFFLLTLRCLRKEERVSAYSSQKLAAARETISEMAQENKEQREKLYQYSMRKPDRAFDILQLFNLTHDSIAETLTPGKQAQLHPDLEKDPDACLDYARWLYKDSASRIHAIKKHIEEDSDALANLRGLDRHPYERFVEFVYASARITGLKLAVSEEEWKAAPVTHEGISKLNTFGLTHLNDFVRMKALECRELAERNSSLIGHLAHISRAIDDWKGGNHPPIDLLAKHRPQKMDHPNALTAEEADWHANGRQGPRPPAQDGVSLTKPLEKVRVPAVEENPADAFLRTRPDLTTKGRGKLPTKL